MILISTKSLKEGMICARPIFASNGAVLIDEGVLIKERYISKLKDLGIANIYVRDDLDDKIEIHDIVRSELKQSSLIAIENIMNNICLFDEGEFEHIKGIIVSIVDELLTAEDILVNISDMRTVDNYTFGHSVNVSILSMVIGLSLGYSKEKLIDLGVGAILHDIGKTEIDIRILNKPHSLSKSEFETIKKHTILGYSILNNIKNISFDSRMIALSHHERFDGNGYPHNLKGEDIHEYTRIVSIADVYDALISDRVYRTKISTDEAIDYVESMAGTQFDKCIVDNFLKNVARYPVGKGVILNTGLEGYVVSNNKKHISRPVVRILYNNAGSKVKIPYIIDLSETDDSINIVGTTDNIELF